MLSSDSSVGVKRPLDFGGHPRLHRYNFLLQQRKQFLEGEKRTSVRQYVSTSVCKEEYMVILVIVFMVFVVLDIAAFLWGYDSRDEINGVEWKCRKEWMLSHLIHHD